MASIEPRNGGYMVRWRVHGKQRSKMHPTLTAAKAHKAQVESDLHTGMALDPQLGKMHFRDWATVWNSHRQGLAESTKLRNKSLMNNHIAEEFGSARLSEITQPQIQEFISNLHTSGRLAPASIREVHGELKMCLQAAVEAGRLRENPCVAISLPKVEQHEMLFLEPAQVRELAHTILPRYRALVLTQSYAGLRIGEAAALTPSDVDLEKGLIHVTKSTSEVGGHIITKQPKTKAGRRSIPITPFIINVLRDHMERYPSEFVFAGRQGGQLRPPAFRQRAWKNAKAQSPTVPNELRIHDLRHTAISFWIANGVDLLRLKKWAGHDSATFTLDRYGHLYEDDNAAILGRLDRAMSAS